ncbi:LysE family transporter [Pasteurellaceae bacterium HPA106]|uniref:LysE family transporter n=1 Tax=Spirabiliibacterium pneumoniae TaxID=221400 RepID=UPI001AAD4200|nr:LysE family transporter [Spirabiliibacterium pneumoniae]MBE2896523.1 LysE family transporter [Spirabiliibacterium pneumoniae]
MLFALKILLIHTIALMSPGPDFFFVARKSLAEPRHNVVLGILGICAGLSIWVVGSIVGLAILFALYPAIQSAVWLLGGAYLGYVGVKLLGVRRNMDPSQLTNTPLKASSSRLNHFRQGLWVNLSNAKVLIFFSGIFSMLVSHLGAGWVGFVAVMVVLESFVYFYLVARLFSLQAVKQFYLQYSRYIDNLCGLVFVSFGLFLIYSALQTGLNA